MWLTTLCFFMFGLYFTAISCCQLVILSCRLQKPLALAVMWQHLLITCGHCCTNWCIWPSLTTREWSWSICSSFCFSAHLSLCLCLCCFPAPCCSSLLLLEMTTTTDCECGACLRMPAQALQSPPYLPLFLSGCCLLSCCKWFKARGVGSQTDAKAFKEAVLFKAYTNGEMLQVGIWAPHLHESHFVFEPIGCTEEVGWNGHSIIPLLTLSRKWVILPGRV